MAYEVYAQGELNSLQVYLQGAALAGPFYVGLGTGAVPSSNTTTLADIDEVVGTGYARQAVARSSVSGTGWVIASNIASSPTFTFTNTSLTTDWTDADFAFLTLSPSGTSGTNVLIGAAELGESFILEPGDSQDVIFKFRQI